MLIIVCYFFGQTVANSYSVQSIYLIWKCGHALNCCKKLDISEVILLQIHVYPFLQASCYIYKSLLYTKRLQENQSSKKEKCKMKWNSLCRLFIAFSRHYLIFAARFLLLPRVNLLLEQLLQHYGQALY